MMARHGIEVPPGLDAGAIPAFNEVAEAAKMVRRPRAMTAEGAYVFSLGTLVRDPPGTR